jgi:uncharacterized protein with von Willebrand factor type A (vWA) domain
MTSADQPASRPGLPAFLADIVTHLRRRRVQVGLDDLRDLRSALRAGFGLASTTELRDLCVALWATSADEAQIIRAAFASVDGIPEWSTEPAVEAEPAVPGSPGDPGKSRPESASPLAAPGPADEPMRTSAVQTGKSGLGPPPSGVTDRRLVLVPQYPLAGREVAQAWRHLRRPVRSGPPAELDVAATIRERTRRGVATPPVVVPRRRNAVQVLLLLDRNGSMSPFHGYVDYVAGAIRETGRIDSVLTAYFHDVPGEHSDRSVLADALFRANLDPALPEIGALREGRVYDDPSLTAPRPLSDMLGQITAATGVLVISDAGAARGKFDLVRLMDTVALLKAVGAVESGSSGVAWLNPVPAGKWRRTTAAAIARHVPMYPITRVGLDQAVDALRGRPVTLARPL